MTHTNLLFLSEVLTFSKATFSKEIFLTEIQKELNKISKLKGCEDLAGWIKPCINHLYWSALSTYDGNGRVIVAKFKSFLSHMTNKHDNLEDPVFNKCAHDENITYKQWFKPSK